jgi:quinol monooxygenase YgiN
MAEALILEFEGLTKADYHAVSAKLGLDDAHWTQSAAPEGLITHIAGEKPGGFVVLEVWESKAAQEKFMNERLGKALQEGGVTSPPSRVEWLAVEHYEHIG